MPLTMSDAGESSATHALTVGEMIEAFLIPRRHSSLPFTATSIARIAA